MARSIAGDPGVALSPEVERLRAVLQDHRHVCIEEALMRAAGVGRDAGMAVFVRPAAYPLTYAGTSTAATYEQKIQDRSPFVIASISRPAAGALLTHLRVNSREYVDQELLADHVLDDETSVSPLPWPAAIVGTGNEMIHLEATGTGLTSSALIARGWHVDQVLAGAVRAAGELAMFGFNKAFTAASEMKDVIPRQVVQPVDVELLVATETLTGDAVRASLSIKAHQHELYPVGGPIPPLTVRKPGARVSIPLRCNNLIELTPRYTSAAGTGTATLRTTWIGRRVNA